MLIAVFWLVVAESPAAKGWSFTGTTAIDTVDELLSALPSFALNAKLSGPL
jgi:hypothetical protein